MPTPDRDGSPPAIQLRSDDASEPGEDPATRAAVRNSSPHPRLLAAVKAVSQRARKSTEEQTSWPCRQASGRWPSSRSMLILRSRSVRRVAETSRSRCRLGSRHSATAVFMITSTAGRARPGAPVVRAPLGIRPRCYHSHQRAIRYSHNLIEQRERLRGRLQVGPAPQRIRARTSPYGITRCRR